MDYLEIILKAVVSVSVSGLFVSLMAYIKFFSGIRIRMKDMQERLEESEKTNRVILYTQAAIFDKVFKNIENGKKVKAEELLNEIIFKIEKYS